MADNIVKIVDDFLSCEDAKTTRKTLWEMYIHLMMSNEDVSTDERKSYTYLCSRISDFLSDIRKAHKELAEELNNVKASSSS